MPSANTPKRPLGNTLALLALWVVFYGSFTLFTPALLDDADSVHAEVAREMLLRHDWVTLYANGIRYLEKAPLLYWSMAASMRVSQLLGHPSARCLAVAARIPLALTILALAFAVEAFARRAFHSARAGLYAALILLSSFGVFIFSRITIPDAMVCLWLTLAMYAFWLTEQADRPPAGVPHVRRSLIASTMGLRLSCYAFAACCALNVLTKGLIGIVFPIAIVLIHLLLTRGPRATITRIGGLHPLSSAAVFLAIAAPWHVLIALANPSQGLPGGLAFAHGHWSVPLPTQSNVHGWLWFYFVNEQVLRYLNLRVPRDYDTVPLWLFWGLCLIWLMPWSAFVFHAIAQATGHAWNRLRSHPQESLRGRPATEGVPQGMKPESSQSVCGTDKSVPLSKTESAGPFERATILHRKILVLQERIYLVLIVWALVPLLFFSLSTRQEYYVLPAFPPLILLIAGWLGEDNGVEDVRRGRANLRITLALLILGTGFAAASVFFLLHTRTPSANTDLAALLQQNPSDYAMSMGHFLDLNAQALGLFRLPLAIAAANLFLGPLISYVLRKRNQPHAATLALAAGAFGLLLAAHLGLRTFAPVLSSQQLAAAIAPQLHPDDLIVIHQEYEYASTLGFYLRRNDLHILEGRSSNLWYGSFFADASQIFETPQSLAQKWAGPQRIFLWQDLGGEPSPLPALPGPVYVIAKSGGKQIVSNRPGS